MSVRPRVMLQEEIRKLLLPLGIPQTVGELKTILQETFEIKLFEIKNFTIQFQDEDFDGQFFTLLYKTKDIKDKDTIKVVLIETMITLTFENSLTAKGVHQSVDPIL